MAENNGVFDQSAAVYDLLYGEKDSEGEAEWVRQRLLRYGVEPGSSLLEFGSGTGRHARIFADMGHPVTAVEPSTEMLDRAIPHPRVNYVMGDTHSTRLPDKFGAVLALFHVMSYHTRVQDVHNLFDTASQHLNSGGLFGFDVWFTPAVHSLKPEVREIEKHSDTASVQRIATPHEDVLNSLVTVRYSYTVLDRTTGHVSEFQEEHHMRHFTYTEIVLLAKAHGFSIVESVEFLTENPPSRDTWGVWFTLEKE